MIPSADFSALIARLLGHDRDRREQGLRRGLPALLRSRLGSIDERAPSVALRIPSLQTPFLPQYISPQQDLPKAFSKKGAESKEYSHTLSHCIKTFTCNKERTMPVSKKKRTTAV
jgi:hypothetical protein